jgi:hypothetical protein|tara:strand:+ start:530 stop:925 length:396 start_codon:yes stop_codon:yes gene_type:complete
MKIRNMQQKYGVNWSSNRRFKMAQVDVSGGGGGGGSGGAGGNGGCIVLVTSNLTPTTSNPMGSFQATDTITDGSITVKLQNFANMNTSGGEGGDKGLGGGVGGFGTPVGDPGDNGLDGNDGREGIKQVIFI